MQKVFRVCGGLILSAMAWASVQAPRCQASEEPQPIVPITLKIALYPYVPERRALFLELQQAFQATHFVPDQVRVLRHAPNKSRVLHVPTRAGSFSFARSAPGHPGERANLKTDRGVCGDGDAL